MMNRTGKVLTALLTSAAVCSLLMFPVYAEMQTFTEDGSATVQIRATIEGSYSVLLPVDTSLSVKEGDASKYEGRFDYGVKGTGLREDEAIVIIPRAATETQPFPEAVAKASDPSGLSSLARGRFNLLHGTETIGASAILTKTATGTTGNGFVRFRSSSLTDPAGPNEIKLPVNDSSEAATGHAYIITDAITTHAGSYEGDLLFSWRKVIVE